mgnify:CR=1 FL=1|nr:MAG TPA: Baseplate component [Caudoviricetes sp.]
MEVIKRQIFVLRDTLKDIIDYNIGTDMVPIEYHVMDFTVPATAAAVVYVLKPDGELDKILADVLDNVISFQPAKEFFLEGLNAIQIRVVDNNKTLVSFTETVRARKNMKFDDDAEAQQKTLIEQLLTKMGESDGNMKIERAERIAGDENEKAERNKAIAAEQKEREKEIDVERQRINNLAKLQEGSTTGDAELADIRTGADGKIYENAGEAVRGQVTALKEETSELKKGILDLTKDEKLLKSINIHMLNGYFNITGNKIVGISSVVHWKNVTIDCKTNERYEILFYVGSNISVDGNILITNDSNEILEKYSGNKLDDYNVKIITIPPGGTKLNIQMFVKYADQNIFVNKYFDTTNEMTYNYKPLLMLGGINEDGTLNDNDARKRTEFIECENQLIEVFVPVGYKAYVIMYDKNKNKMDTTSSWIDASEKEKSYKYYVTGCYVIIVLKNKNDSSMVGWFAKDFYLTKETVVLDKNDRYKYFLSRQGEFTNIPTNSIQSICYAHEHGFNAIRISVLWTKDDVCVLCHDDLITKWAKKNDGSDITEQVRISELTYEQLKDYDFGVQYAQKYKGLKIAKLRDVLKLTKMLNMFLKIELKADRYDEIDNLIGDIIECGDIKNTVVSCDYYSIKKSLDYLSENYPYINLEIYANFDLNLVKQVLPYKNDTRELWIGGDKEDLEYDDRVTLDAIKLAKENDMKLSIGSAYNADELIKLYNSPFDQLSTAYIEYPKHVLDKVLKYK